MSKPIKLTEGIIAKMIQEFTDTLRKSKLSDGTVRYTQAWDYKESHKAKLLFAPMAYAKMLSVIMHFDDEVAWHGTVHRVDEFTFVIDDILVYPQTVTDVTVNTDQEEYQKWMMNLDDEVYNHMHMQGHSHVNMATSPSSTDMAHQESILECMQGDQFYIFMIYNKKLEHTISIFDLKANTLYEDKDIEIGILGSDTDIGEFIQEADGMVEKKRYAYSYVGGSSSGASGSSDKGSKKKSDKRVSHYTGLYAGLADDDMDDPIDTDYSGFFRNHIL